MQLSFICKETQQIALSYRLATVDSRLHCVYSSPFTDYACSNSGEENSPLTGTNFPQFEKTRQTNKKTEAVIQNL